MTRTKKILAAIIVALMVAAVLPVAAVAEGAALKIDELLTENHWQKVWAPLNQVEAEMIAAGASPAECTMAVYKAALVNPDIDAGSISDIDGNAFSFRTKGMCGGYDYKVRNVPHVSAFTPEVMEVVVQAAAARAEATKDSNCPTSANVLLVGPYYGYDSSFTDQYQTEASSIATATGGTLTKITGTNATGPAIASAYTDKGVVIYDSHGNCISANQTSYLDLRSSTGLTSSDYSNGWAYNGSSFYGIDGRYIQNHASGTLSNCFVWMAICEGMKKEGKGTTGTALLAKGAACVYGYSQSVSFTGDYKYEATFWTQMKNGATVKNAIATMKSTHGNWDPAYSSSSGAAWPIVMSPVDSFPSNPDGTQTVNCEWVLFGESDPDPITSVSVADMTVVTGGTAQAQVTVNPSNADYTIQSYTSSNTSVATVTSAGVVTGVAAGTSTLTVRVKDNTNNSIKTATATITVEDFEGFALVDSLEVGGRYIIASGSYAVGNTIYSSNHYLTAKSVTINSDNTVTVPSSVSVNDILWICESGSASAGYNFKNVGNNKYMGLDDGQYLYPSDTAVAWLYENVTSSGGDLNNQVDTDGYYYLALGSSSAYFTTSKNTNGTIKFYKYITGSSQPEPVYYTVTFKDWDGTVIRTEQVEQGNSAVAPGAPSRVGYTFTGWDTDFSNVQSDLVVTATYVINTYYLTIYYKYEGGATAANTYVNTVTYGAAYSVTSPVIEGYTASQPVVSGTMGAGDVEVTVIYTANPVDPEVNPGDVNDDGIIDFSDISFLYMYLTGVYTPDDQGVLNADVNGDGNVDFTDVSALQAIMLS